MKTFTVKEVAELLKINPETVRRWIRNGDLDAIQTSRKKGNLISEDALKGFAKRMPQYAPFIIGMYTPAPISLGVVIGGLIANIIISFREGKTRQVQSNDVKIFIEKKIAYHQKAIAKNERELSQIRAELKKNTDKLKEYEFALQNIDFQEIADEINNQTGE